MSERRSLGAGVVTALAGTMVLGGWIFDIAAARSLIPGWRVMVPSTAFSFACAGAALVVGSSPRAERLTHRLAMRVLAGAAIALPLATLVEYAADMRLGVESWLGVPVPGTSPVAGRISPMTSLCFLPLGLGLAALTWHGVLANRVVRLAGGTTLMVSWLAVLAMSFEPSRLLDEPRFPGMAVMTIVLMAVASAGTLAASPRLVSELRQVDADRVFPRWILASTSLLPLALGAGQSLAARESSIDASLATAVVMMGCAFAATVLGWEIASRIQRLRDERTRAMADLEQRVIDRTRDLATANDALRSREEQLEEADQRKDDFLATLAHELRNPLAPIRNAVHVMQRHGDADPVLAQARSVIERQVSQMVRLVDDLLDVSRIAADKLPLRIEPCDLCEAIAQAVETVRPQMEGARHRFHLQLPDEPLFVHGDPARLTQVFANLLQNACKYTEAGGAIALTAERNGDDVEVSVTDTGIGIPPVFLPRLFEKFSQVAPSLERSQGGLGLGLALVRAIVTLHKGRVSARSEGPGRGSVFSVCLPLMTLPHVDDVHRATRASVPSPAVWRVLVVDDNADGAASLAMLLRLHGHTVETALDGEAGLAVAERFRPDVIFLDIGMPKLNGYEVCQLIRARPWGPAVRVIAHTGWGQAQDLRRSREAGFDGHLTKPFDPAQLEDVLAGAVQQSRP